MLVGDVKIDVETTVISPPRTDTSIP